ncbi:MAG: LytTR family transcriptional regulator, partial [Bacteroides sp.]|nr:LytTR family transcriptional regulator [Bacteroides sp.]
STPTSKVREKLNNVYRVKNQVINLAKPLTTEEEYLVEPMSAEYPDVIIRDSYCLIWEKRKFRLEPIDSIYYLKADRSCCEIHFTEGNPILVSVSMNTVAAQLPEKDFIRIQKSYTINLKHTKYLTGNTFIMKNGERLTIGPEYREEVYSSLIFIGTKSKKYRQR